jgi:hypothetical protein
MNDGISVVLHTLKSFISEEICDKTLLEKIRKTSYDKYDRMISMLNSQTGIHDVENSYSLFSIPCVGGDVVTHVTNIYSKIGNMFTTTVQSDGINIYLHTLTIESMMMYLINNNKNRYVFIPATLGTEFKEGGHVALLVFDIKNFEVFFLDPNGKTTYFDSVHKFISSDNFISIDTNERLDRLMNTYIDSFNLEWGLNYKFISSREWNPAGYVLNRTFSSSDIGTGHCVISIIMLTHLLALTGDTIKKIYEMIASMSDTETLYVINCYTAHMISLMS